MAESVKVRRSSAVKVLNALGRKNAALYAPKRLLGCMTLLPELAEEADVSTIEDVTARKVLELVCSAVSKGRAITIVEG